MPTTESWLIITPKQLKEGWIEVRGVTPVHHSFLILQELEDGNYVVRNPKLWIEEHPGEQERNGR